MVHTSLVFLYQLLLLLPSLLLPLLPLLRLKRPWPLLPSLLLPVLLLLLLLPAGPVLLLLPPAVLGYLGLKGSTEVGHQLQAVE